MKQFQAALLGGIAISAMILNVLSEARAESVGLAWKPSPSVGATGYNVYYGVSGSFTNKHDAGNVTSTAIHDLAPGHTYFFYATTYDATGDESGPSETVQYKVNQGPSASNLSVETLRSAPLAITLLGSDPDGDAVSYTVVDAPVHGALSGAAPDLLYTPAPGYTGPDGFAYRVSDGQVDSSVATVSIVVAEPPDTQAPSLAIEAPAEGSTVSGMTAVTVAAVDNVAVAKVELYLNGQLSGTAGTAPAVFTWDTRTHADGPCKLQAVAYDLTGNSAVSSSVNVSVKNVAPDLSAPSVDILSPRFGSKVSGIVQIEVTAQDDGTLAEVLCFIDDTLAGSSTSAPASFAWNTTAFPDGVHTIKAQATDAAGNRAEVLRIVTVANDQPPVAGIYVFYNNSAWDGRNPAPNANDDNAIAPDKTPLLPGGKATFANYTSYNRGINGIMVDVSSLPGTPQITDFTFKTGNDDHPDGWADAPPPASISVRWGQGSGGSDRITFVWDDGTAVVKHWLEVTVLPTANTGFLQPYTFYFGNAVGETGAFPDNAYVNASDSLGARANQRSLLNPAPIDFRFDFNRDMKVDAADQLITRANQTTVFNGLRLLDLRR